MIGDVCHSVSRSSSRRHESKCRGREHSCRREGIDRIICDRAVESSRIHRDSWGRKSNPWRTAIAYTNDAIKEAESIAKEWKTNRRHHVDRSLKIEARREGYLLSCHELRWANNWNKSAGAVTACGKTIKCPSDLSRRFCAV